VRADLQQLSHDAAAWDTMIQYVDTPAGTAHPESSDSSDDYDSNKKQRALKTPTPTATTKAPKTTPTAKTKATSKVPGTTHFAFLWIRLMTLATNTALIGEFAHWKGSTAGTDSGGAYVLKTSKIESMHNIMTQVAAQLDGNAELQMQFSTLLLAINAGLHGFLDPDFIQRIPKHQQQYFLGQLGYGKAKRVGVQSWITKVKALNDTQQIQIPTCIKDRFSSFMQHVKIIKPLNDRSGQPLSPSGKKRSREIFQPEPDDDAEGAIGTGTSLV
jgi:hypothetical protein